MTARAYPNRVLGRASAPSHDAEIVVGVADTGSAHAAVWWAARHASATGAPIALLHVRTRTLPGPARGARELLARELLFVHSVDSAIRVRTGRTHGSVMWALGAATPRAAMVVVGTHKSGFIQGTVYGSTSLQLAATARCPVVVVPALPVAAQGAVVLGADESETGRAALAFAIGEAASMGTTLLIVRVWALPATETEEATRSESGLLGAERLLGRFRASALDASPGTRVEVRAVRGSIARSLVTTALGGQLLVLGAARRPAGSPSALGAVCHDALMNIQTPTAIVHGDIAA